MSTRITGIAGEIRKIKAAIKEHNMKVRMKVANAMITAMKAGMSRTPVYSGEAVRNYHVGVNRTPSRAATPVGGHVAFPGPAPEDTKNEQRRPGNEAAALGDANTHLARFISMKKIPGVLMIRNTSRIADLVENGSAPDRARSRYTGGVTAIMRQALVGASGGTIR